MEQLKQQLRAEGIGYRENEPLAAHCTFKIGGPADVFAQPETEEQLCRTIALCRECGVKYYLLGNGSNILFADEGFSGVVIDVSALDAEIAVEDTVLTAGAGVRLAALCKAALKHGLSGLEFAYGIPGTVGGAVYMNAGAYGGEMKDVVVSCRYITEKGDIKEIPLEKMELSYRHSFFSERNLCITSVKMKLAKGEREKIKDRMDTLMERRKDKQPLEYPSAGSTFKRPEGDFAARLIEVCGLKGTACGGAEVSTKHSGFVINKDNATFDDVMGVVDIVKQKVKEQTGVTLECEVLIMK